MKRDFNALKALYDTLDDDARNSLFDYAAFLQSRSAPVVRHPGEPLQIPRQDNETVVGAIKRMKRTYPMIDSMKVFSVASNLMTEHMINGRDAEEVINEIEQLFEQTYQELLKDFQ